MKTNFYRIFESIMDKLTGKQTNSRKAKTKSITDAEMEAIALSMKHSREVQRSVYDR